MARSLTAKRIITLLSVCLFLFMTACGGGDEPPPPHVPTDQEAEALKKFNEAANDFQQKLLQGQKLEADSNDQFMNALLLYLSSDGGQKSNESISYLIWYLKNIVKSNIPMFKQLPKEMQQGAMANLGQFYQNYIQPNSDPLAQYVLQLAVSQTNFPTYFTGF